MFCKSKAETALEGRPRVLGPDHEHACSRMNNVANGLREQGRWQEAEEMHRQASDGPWTRPPRYLELPVRSGCLPARTGRSGWHFRVEHLKDPSFHQKRVEEAGIIEKPIVPSQAHVAPDHLRRQIARCNAADSIWPAI